MLSCERLSKRIPSLSLNCRDKLCILKLLAFLELSPALRLHPKPSRMIVPTIKVAGNMHIEGMSIVQLVIEHYRTCCATLCSDPFNANLQSFTS